MIRPEPIVVDGRPGVIVFLDKDRQPVEPSDPTAVVARAVFDDGGSATYQVQPPAYSLDWDESLHPRDDAGKFAENAAKEAEYQKLQANRAQDAALTAATAGLAADTAPGGRWEHFDQRQETQHKLQQRLKKLLPPGSVAIISSPTPNLLRAGEVTANVLEEMKGHGLTMPDRIMVESVAGHELGGAVHGVTVQTGADLQKEKHLHIKIPETLPEHTVLDDAVKAVFGKPSAVIPKYAYKDMQYPQYDKFTARTMEDIITHEMGHVQAGHRGAMPVTDLLQRGTFGSLDGIRRAAMRVSEYANSNQDEFVAEAFTRLYRGETLADDSEKLYNALNGPPVFFPRKKP